MSHTSPASFLVWAVISTMLGAFLVFHLWSFDRFRCLRWNNGTTGAFKRIMTYSYLLSVPLIMTYSIGFAIIKYTEGFVALPFYGIMPKPYQAWGPGPTRAIFPLNLAFSVAWSLEMVTHLEELCFWLFLVNSGSMQQSWFKSWYFKTWMAGSTIAVIYMPLVTIFTRDDPLKSEAYTFLAGSLGSLSLTVWFTPILWTFPAFLEHLRAEGVDTSTIVRLTKFSELNTIRICFRFLFVVPLLILGVDGVHSHVHINDKMVWTDFLAILAGFGCAISSGMTLVIFFPRSIEGEIATRDAARERKRTRSFGKNSSMMVESNAHTRRSASFRSPQEQVTGPYDPSSSPPPQHTAFDGTIDDHDQAFMSPQKYWNSDEDISDIAANLPTLPPLRPNRRRGQDIELGTVKTLSENNLSKHNRRVRQSNVNPMVHNFTSPIDLMGDLDDEPRLTFNPR